MTGTIIPPLRQRRKTRAPDGTGFSRIACLGKMLTPRRLTRTYKCGCTLSDDRLPSSTPHAQTKCLELLALEKHRPRHPTRTPINADGPPTSSSPTQCQTGRLQAHWLLRVSWFYTFGDKLSPVELLTHYLPDHLGYHGLGT